MFHIELCTATKFSRNTLLSCIDVSQKFDLLLISAKFLLPIISRNELSITICYMVVVPMDWRGACIVPLYKGKGDKCEFSNSRGISFLSVVCKLYGRVLIKRVRAGTECAIEEEQCRFRQGRWRMDQVSAVRKVCEKYLPNGKDVFWVFKDFERLCDTIERIPRVYGVGGNLLKAVQSFHVQSRACVRVGMDVST